MKIKINAFLNIEFCVKQRQQHQKQWQPYSVHTQIYVQCRFQSNFHASLEQRWIFIFNGLSHSQLFVRFLLLFFDKVVKQMRAEKCTATWRTRVMDTYCQLWFTICKWQLASSAQAHSHTQTPTFCYLKSILKHGRTTVRLNILYTHQVPGDNEWHILFENSQTFCRATWKLFEINLKFHSSSFAPSLWWMKSVLFR